MSDYLSSITNMSSMSQTIIVGVVGLLLIIGIAFFLNRKINNLETRVVHVHETITKHEERMAELQQISEQQNQMLKSQDGIIRQMIQVLQGGPPVGGQQQGQPQGQSQMYSQHQGQPQKQKVQTPPTKGLKKKDIVKEMDDEVQREIQRELQRSGQQNDITQSFEIDCVDDGECELKPTLVNNKVKTTKKKVKVHAQ